MTAKRQSLEKKTAIGFAALAGATFVSLLLTLNAVKADEQALLTSLTERKVPAPQPMDVDAANAALEIFALLDHGAQTGNWGPFLARVREDVSWWAPVEGFQGYHKGKSSLEELFAHHTGATRTEWTLNNLLVNGNEIALEARVEGEIMQKRYANQLLMLWRIDEEGMIVQMREYAGFINGVGDLSGVGDVSSGRDAFDYRAE